MKKKASDYKYPNIIIEMARNGETQERLGKILGLNRMTVGQKLMGNYDWSISEIEAICNHYQKNYYELFKGE